MLAPRAGEDHAAGQLIAANSTAASPAPNQSYSYDSNGNRVAASTPSRSMGEGAVAAETTSSYLTGANNTLLSDGVYRYSYDAAGNRIGQTLLDTSAATATTVVTTLFSYDNHNRLVEVVQQNGSHQALASVRYTYDLFDRLIGRDQRDYVTQAGDVSSAVQNQALLGQVWDGSNVLCDFISQPVFNGAATGGGNTPALQHRFLWGDQPDELIAEETVNVNTNGVISAPTNGLPGYNAATGTLVAWAVTDQQRSVTAALDSNGNVLTRYTYDAYGKRLSGDPSILSRGYTGKWTDPTTGLQYNIERWLDLLAGRWINHDPLGFKAGSMNLTEYVEDDPMNGTDPSGLYEEDVHFYLTYYIARSIGLGKNGSGLTRNGSEVNEAYAAAWATQYTDDNSETSPFKSVDIRARLHFRLNTGANEVEEGSSSAAAPANSAIAGADILQLGIGLHALEDSYSHAGYGPKTGHWSKDPDRPYTNKEKALRMAEQVYKMLDKWRAANHCESQADKSFAELQTTLKTLLDKPGSLEERVQRWQAQIAKDFGETIQYQHNGDKDEWAATFLASANKIKR